LLPSLLYNPQSTISAKASSPQPTSSLKHQNEKSSKAKTTMSESITAAQVKEHSTPETGLYIIIDNSVYSMASFADEHPGGSKILKRVGGKGKFFYLSISFRIFFCPIFYFFDSMEGIERGRKDGKS
jgi:hypothetical protein